MHALQDIHISVDGTRPRTSLRGKEKKLRRPAHVDLDLDPIEDGKVLEALDFVELKLPEMMVGALATAAVTEIARKGMDMAFSFVESAANKKR